VAEDSSFVKERREKGEGMGEDSKRDARSFYNSEEPWKRMATDSGIGKGRGAG